MASLPPTLPRTIDPNVDVERLYALGVEHVQRLSGGAWTDFNVHDPGVTMLELLCFTLTELNYRSAFPVADLLRSGGEDAAKSTLFPAARILTQRPLTTMDYRKLLVDLPEVRNAWLLPAEMSPRIYADTRRGVLQYTPSADPEVKAVHVQGLHRVLLDLDPSLSAEEIARVRAEVFALLHDNRNLCEDFVGLSTVPTQYFNLCCEIELEPSADPSLIEAAILFQVDQALTPTVFNYTLEELLTHTHPDGQAWTIEDAFNGPQLRNGFIDDDELRASELKRVIYLSDIINVIQDIPGITAIRDVVFTPDNAPTPTRDRWQVPVRPDHKAQLNPAHSRMVFYKRNSPRLADPVRVQEERARLEAAARQRPRAEGGAASPQGRLRDSSGYFSFQNVFPPLYGLSAESVPTDRRRQALAQQLRGFLLHFDQSMADFLATLGQVGRITSTDSSLEIPRFHQRVESVHRWEDTYLDPTGVLEALSSADQAADPRRTQRNQMLDHLTARFDEDFAAQIGALRSAEFIGVREEIERKCSFLANLPELGAERALAYNLRCPNPGDQWNTTNISGLEKRLAHLLALDDPRRRNLSSVAYDLYTQIDSQPGDRHRFRVRHAETGEILLSSSTSYASVADARAELRMAIELAKTEDAYSRHTTHDGNTWYFNIVNPAGEVVARRIRYFRTPEIMERSIEELKRYLRTNYSDEGLYVIEALLLRPRSTTDPLLAICPDPGCVECFEADPYSHRVHVVLPAYGRRFSDIHFRTLVEQTIRAEVPAHLMPRICWASQEDIAALEGPYRQWVGMLAGEDAAHRAEVLTRLRDALFNIRNVYPPATLASCDAPEEKSRFILGQSAIGAARRTPTEG